MMRSIATTPCLGMGLVLMAAGMALAAEPETLPSLVNLTSATLSRVSRTLHVGFHRQYAVPSQASAACADGDTIVIDAGIYRGDVTTWYRNDLHIIGLPGPFGSRPHLEAAGSNAEGKAIWVVAGSNVEIDNVEFSGCTVPDHNGAGIRQQGAGLTLRDCSFHDNEEGVFAVDSPNSDILFDRCEFARNGAPDGSVANFWISHVRSFTMEDCYSHQANGGQLVKSWARVNRLLYNRLTAESGPTGSAVELSNARLCILIGNLLELGPDSRAKVLVSVTENGPSDPDQAVYLIGNTMVLDRASGGIFVQVVGKPSTSLLQDNLLIGNGTALQGHGREDHDLSTDASAVVDQAHFDYHLVPGSPALASGILPGKAEGFDLTPVFAYRHPLGLDARPATTVADIGAY